MNILTHFLELDTHMMPNFIIKKIYKIKFKKIMKFSLKRIDQV